MTDSAEPKQAQDPVSGGVEQVEGDIEEVSEDAKGRGSPKRSAIGQSNGGGLRDEFAQQNMEEAHQKVAKGKGDSVGGQPLAFPMSIEPSRPRDDRFQDTDDGRFCHKAESDGCEGDAQLANGKIFIESVLDEFDTAGTAYAIVDQFFNRDGRILTAANSARTKKAFRPNSNTARNKKKITMDGSYGCSCADEKERSARNEV